MTDRKGIDITFSHRSQNRHSKIKVSKKRQEVKEKMG